MTDKPEVSVVIPALNCGKWIQHQLEAVAAQRTSRRYEVIVADNGSTDDTYEMAAAFRTSTASVRVFRAAAVRGCGYARNFAASHASGGILLFTDADDIVDHGWMEACLAALAEASIATGPAPDFPDGESPRAYTGTWLPWEPFPGFKFIVACNMAIRAADFVRVGGFVDSLPADDLEFSVRAQSAGLTVAFAQDAVVHHRVPAELRARWQKQRAYGRSAVECERLLTRWDLPAINRLMGWRAVAWLLLRTPYLLVKRDDRRGIWIERSGFLVGRAEARARSWIVGRRPTGSVRLD